MGITAVLVRLNFIDERDDELVVAAGGEIAVSPELVRVLTAVKVWLREFTAAGLGVAFDEVLSEAEVLEVVALFSRLVEDPLELNPDSESLDVSEVLDVVIAGIGNIEVLFDCGESVALEEAFALLEVVELV